MARKIQPDGEPPVVEDDLPESGEPETIPPVESGPVPVVELDDVIQAETLSPEQQQAGVRFWFGEIGVLTFPDKTTYHIRGHNAFITDPELIEKLKAHAERVPTAKIFIQ